MIDIQWRLMYTGGYGDIISPLCYAHNVSFKLKTPVELTFRWQHGPNRKAHPSDPETLTSRADYLASLCIHRETIVDVQHVYGNIMNIKHTNYDWNVVGIDQYHNYWKPHKPNQTNTNTIVVNSTANNICTLSRYGKPWKDPIEGHWHYVIESLSQRYDVVVVDYRTPVEELVRLLQSARGFFGYHGTAAWVAKFMHTPSIIFSDGGTLTRNAFPYAHVESKVSVLSDVLSDPERFFKRSEQQAQMFAEMYDKYTPNPAFVKSLTYEL